MSATASTLVAQKIRLRNTTGQQQELWLEPMGDRVVLEPDALYELTATDTFDEIDFLSDGFTVIGWVIRVSKINEDGSTLTVWEMPR